MFMKCPECLKKISFFNELRLVTVSDKVICEKCGCIVKFKTSKFVIVLDLIHYCFLFLIGIMFYREGFSIYVAMIFLFWLAFYFYLNVSISKVEKDDGK